MCYSGDVTGSVAGNVTAKRLTPDQRRRMQHAGHHS